MKNTITIYQNKGSREEAYKPDGFSTRFTIADGDTESMSKAVSFDNCTAEYEDGYKRGDNFKSADCILADIDNTFSDSTSDWITHDDVIKALPDVKFYYYPIRNNMKPKDGKSPRPKEHYIFPIDEVDSLDEYTGIMKKLINSFKELHFDEVFSGGAQLNFGVENAKVTYVDGKMNLSEYFRINNDTTEESSHNSDTHRKSSNRRSAEIIPEGQRNDTLFRAALSFLTRHGADDDTAYELYIKESEKCSPPLEQKELSSIWKSALKYYNKDIVTNPKYIPPKNFNTDKPQIEWELPLTDKKSMETLLSLSKSRKKVTLDNIRLILNAFGISLRKNEMNRAIEVSGLPDKFLEEDAFKNLQTIVEDTASKIPLSRNISSTVYDNLAFIASENHYHPVLKLLESRSWDGKDRLESIYQILDLKDDFHKTLVRKWAIQTIALLYNSSSNKISAQGVLVLQDAQGVGKTEFFRHLAIRHEFFKGGATIDMTNKDSLISATRVWICELGELDSTTKKMQSALKAFLTEQTDRYREPYERTESIRPRRTSFCGTVNPKQFLHDETGNRRYWTIPVDNIDIKTIFSKSEEWYTQFWLQICEEYRKAPKGYLLTPEENAKVNQSNESFETSLYGEDEFLTVFDVEADKSLWQRKTAAEITEILNSHFQALRITASSLGKDLIPRLEKRLGVIFETKKSCGKLYKLCPPVRAEYKTDEYTRFNADSSENEIEELHDYIPEF